MKRRALKRRYGRSRWGDFDLQTEMQEGYVLSDGRSGGYDVRGPGRFSAHSKSRGAAFRAVAEHMEKSQYWPSVFYVNDHGNVSLYSVRIDERGKVMSRYLKGWV